MYSLFSARTPIIKASLRAPLRREPQRKKWPTWSVFDAFCSGKQSKLGTRPSPAGRQNSHTHTSRPIHLVSCVARSSPRFAVQPPTPLFPSSASPGDQFWLPCARDTCKRLCPAQKSPAFYSRAPGRRAPPSLEKKTFRERRFGASRRKKKPCGVYSDAIS